MKLVMIKIPEGNDGSYVVERILVATDDIQAVRKAMRGTKQGPMGIELNERDFEVVDVLSMTALRKRFRKN